VSVVGGRLLLFDVAHIILLDEMLDVRQHVVQVIESLLSILESGVAFVLLVLLHYPIFQGLNKKSKVNKEPIGHIFLASSYLPPLAVFFLPLELLLESVEPLSNLFNNGVKLFVFTILGIELGLVLIALLRSPNRCVFPATKRQESKINVLLTTLTACTQYIIVDF
jgi:hypothetical protein